MEFTKDNSIAESISQLKEVGGLDHKASVLVGELMGLAIEIAELEYKILNDLQTGR